MGSYRLIFLALGLVAFTGCKEKAPETGGYTPLGASPSSSDAVPNSTYLPTNPNGGRIGNKDTGQGDPVINAEKINRNISQPVVWGQSLGGISMTTSRQDAEEILAPPFSGGGFFTIYPENVAVAWDPNNSPSFPAILVAFGDYAGPIQLPAPFGTVYIGQNMSDQLIDDPSGYALLRDIGRSIEAQTPAYDCRADLTCAMVNLNGRMSLDFKNGRIVLDNFRNIVEVYIIPNQQFSPRLTGEFIYGTSVSGVGLGVPRSQIVGQIGAPQTATQDGLEYFDDANFVVGYDLNLASSVLGVEQNYLGDIVFPAPINNRKMDSSFRDIAGVDDDGTELIKILDRALNERAPDYDCIADQTCRLQILGSVIAVELSKGFFVFTNDQGMNLIRAAIVPERLFLPPL